MTGIATAYMDSVPMVALTGNVARDLLGRDGFQEADITGITLPITKHNTLVMRASEVAQTVKEAFHIASTGRKGPVLVDIPKDVFIEQAEYEGYPEAVHLRGYPLVERPRALEVERAAELINGAQRPVILAGQGVIMSGASEELRAMAERADIPVITTLLGVAGFPADHPLAYGFLGMHGHYYCNMAADEADVVIGIGMRFDDRAMGRFKDFNPTAQIVHIDIDPAEIGKNFHTQAPVQGDVRETLRLLNPMLADTDHPKWRAWIEKVKAEHPTDYFGEETELTGTWLVKALAEETQGEATIVTGVGQHQMWAAQYYPFKRPRQWVTSGGLGTMGYEVPGAIGAQFAQDDPVWTICGDGGFQMTLQELQTVKDHNLPIRYAIFNNGFLGMVRQWQELFYADNQHSVDLGQPDFVKLAEAYGIKGLRAGNRQEALRVIREAAAHEGPVLMDFRTAGVGERMAHGAGGGGPVRDDRGASLMPDESNKALSVIVAHVEDRPGVLARVASLFRRRGFNIESLTVGRADEPGLSRMTIVVEGGKANGAAGGAAAVQADSTWCRWWTSRGSRWWTGSWR